MHVGERTCLSIKSLHMNFKLREENKLHNMVNRKIGKGGGTETEIAVVIVMDGNSILESENESKLFVRMYEKYIFFETAADKALSF